MKGLPIVFRPRFNGHPEGFSVGGGYLDDMLASWKRVFPASATIDADEEDWIENAVILHEIVAKHPDRLALVGENDEVKMWQSGMVVPAGSAIVFFGIHNGREPLFNDEVQRNYAVANLQPDEVTQVLHYPQSDVFAHHAGRKVKVCGADKLVDTLGLNESIVERLMARTLAVPAARFLRMKRSVNLLVSDCNGNGIPDECDISFDSEGGPKIHVFRGRAVPDPSTTRGNTRTRSRMATGEAASIARIDLVSRSDCDRRSQLALADSGSGDGGSGSETPTRRAAGRREPGRSGTAGTTEDRLPGLPVPSRIPLPVGGTTGHAAVLRR